MRRRKFSREFKLEAVKPVRERGISAAQASRDLKAERDILKKAAPTSAGTRYEVRVHREAPGIWPVSWICEALGVSRSGFHVWLVRAPSARARSNEEFGARVRASFISSCSNT